MPTSSSTSRALLVGGNFCGAMLIAALPFAVHVLPSYMGAGVMFNSLPPFLTAFVLCGIAGGLFYGFIAIAASIVTHIIVIALLTKIRFVGGGGDGDLFYLVALFGTAAFCASALVAALFRYLRTA
jgi:hypothetical protein